MLHLNFLKLLTIMKPKNPHWFIKMNYPYPKPTDCSYYCYKIGTVVFPVCSKYDVFRTHIDTSSMSRQLRVSHKYDNY